MVLQVEIRLIMNWRYFGIGLCMLTRYVELVAVCNNDDNRLLALDHVL